MVRAKKKNTFLIAILLISLNLFAEVKLSVSLDDTVQYENTPIAATLTIDHNSNEKIDPQSATIENKPLSLEFVKEVRFSASDPMTLSIYRFTLPGAQKGLHSLPVISLKVDGKIYKTYSLAYEVKALPESNPEAIAPSNKPILLLEAFIDPSTPLYPGERAKVGYRYYFNADFKAVKEEIPLLDAEGFKKIGGKQDRTVNNGNLALLEVSQLVEAVTPGSYSFGPSVYEAYPVTPGVSGEKIKSGPSISATSPKMTIVVNPFPDEGKPPFFKGAIGEYSISTKLVSGPNVKVGEKISVELSVSGKGPLNTVTLPDICCQPEVSGFFKLDDLPPPSEKEGEGLTWMIEMRPLSANVAQVPSFNFSFFNPESKKYQTVTSSPIAISVEPLQEPKVVQKQERQELVIIKTNVEPVEIAMSVPLSTGDILENPFLSWGSLLLLPLSLAILIYQMRLKEYLSLHLEQKSKKTSFSTLKEALSKPKESNERAVGLKNALLLFLQERGVEHPESREESEDDSEAIKQAYRLIREIDQIRYSLNENTASDAFVVDKLVVDKIEALIRAFGQKT